MVRRAEETPGFLRRQQRAGDHVVDIFDEVEEDLRAERAQQLLKRYGGLIVAVLVVIVAGAPPGTVGSTNLIHVHRIGEEDH